MHRLKRSLPSSSSVALLEKDDQYELQKRLRSAVDETWHSLSSHPEKDFFSFLKEFEEEIKIDVNPSPPSTNMEALTNFLECSLDDFLTEILIMEQN